MSYRSPKNLNFKTNHYISANGGVRLLIPACAPDLAGQYAKDYLEDPKRMEHYGLWAVDKVAFATALKDSIGSAFHLNPAQLWGSLKETLDPYWKLTPREILQRAGVAYRKEFGADFWVRVLERRFIDEPDNSFLVADVRFPEEAALIKKYGGHLVRVDRPIPFNSDIDNRISEVGLDGYTHWDYVVKNDDTKEQLREDMYSLIGFILMVEEKRKLNGKEG